MPGWSRPGGGPDKIWRKYPIERYSNKKVESNLSHGFFQNAYLTVTVPPEPPIILNGNRIKTTETRKVKVKCSSRGGKPAAEVKILIWSSPFFDKILHLFKSNQCQTDLTFDSRISCLMVIDVLKGMLCLVTPRGWNLELLGRPLFLSFSFSTVWQSWGWPWICMVWTSLLP